uniref:hypothetical protein n=1 Tax=Methanomethylophilus alvi TaxID=1291540 RepID=UPI0037DC8AB0
LMDMVLYILSYNYINPRFIYPLYTVYKSEHVRKWSYEGVAQDSGISVETGRFGGMRIFMCPVCNGILETISDTEDRLRRRMGKSSPSDGTTL